MTRKHRGPRRPIDRYYGLAVASACADCAHLIGNPEPSEDGIRMALIHTSHIPELEAQGWITTHYRHQPSDVVCEHYHAANWQGD
jgi:hypothetical protein